MLKKSLKIKFAPLLIILIIFLNWKYAKPEYFINRGEDFYATNEGTTTVANEYMPIWVKKFPETRFPRKAQILSGEAEISNLSLNSKKTTFDIISRTSPEIQINTVYFPGWKVKVDDKPVAISYQNEQGLIRFKTSSGYHQVVAEFKETPLRLFADVVSLISFIYVLAKTVELAPRMKQASKRTFRKDTAQLTER